MTGEGERLEAQRRRKFMRTVAVIAAAGSIGGFIFGFVHGRSAATGIPIGDTARSIAAAALVISAVGGAYGCWRFFITADEVEVADNLWASLVGVCLYVILFPTWWALSWLKFVPEPVGWIIFAAVMLSIVATYSVRRWRSR